LKTTFNHISSKNNILSRLIKNKFCLYFLFLFFPFILAAQTNTPAFENFSLGINYQSNINRNDFHNYWLSDGGVEANFSTPFYFGETQLGIIYVPFSAKSDEQPDYTTLLIYLQWGYKIDLPLNFSVTPSLFTGIYQMNFDDFDLEIDPGLLSERELAAGINALLSYSFLNDWNFTLQLSYLNVFTYKRIQLFNLGLGISKTFSSPQWLKDFLN
jgi:hypothetical protein